MPLRLHRFGIAFDLPRVMIAGLRGDSGKTLVSLGCIKALTDRGLCVAPFKKGPDFIDAAWLTAAAGRAATNLDTFMMLESVIQSAVVTSGRGADVGVIEGNRGLFDGMDASGSHSTAQLAKLTRTPVVLVIDATKTTATIGALVLGCQQLDPAVDLAGVVLNRVGTGRQESVIRQAVEQASGVPVLGAIPRLKAQHLPSRHLGLVTAAEHPDALEAIERVGRAVEQHVDLDHLRRVASRAGALESSETVYPAADDPSLVRIGVLKDKAFSFYYPENLEALEAQGAQLVFISPLDDERLPTIDGLYAGGGFPEVHAAALSRNRSFRDSLRKRIEQGLPVWAECGGLMYLGEALIREGEHFPMVGVLPVTTEQMPRPQGHGYVEARVDADNPFLELGRELRGHEFHYSRLKNDDKTITTVLKLGRGHGVGRGCDGILAGNVVAVYTHLHALGEPHWAPGLVNAARGVMR